MKTRSCKRLLEEILSVWPVSDDAAERQEQIAKIRPYLASNFDDLDFLNKVYGIREIKKYAESGNEITVEFLDSTGDLNKAWFVRGSTESGWRLRSLRFNCPACFGTGKNDSQTCTLCEGLGWGAGRPLPPS